MAAEDVSAATGLAAGGLKESEELDDLEEREPLEGASAESVRPRLTPTPTKRGRKAPVFGMRAHTAAAPSPHPAGAHNAPPATAQSLASDCN